MNSKYVYKLTKILTENLYERPFKSAIRETFTNAIDAHREVNKPLSDIEIDVTLDGFVVIKDYGPGLSEDQVQTIYTVFFESTKHDKSKISYIGNFGLGAKAPFAYTTSFTIISRHKGKATTYLAYNDNGVLKLQKVAEVPCEDSGLTVKLPLYNHTLQEAAEPLAKVIYAQKFWPNIKDEELEKLITTSLKRLLKVFESPTKIKTFTYKNRELTAYIPSDDTYSGTTCISGCTVDVVYVSYEAPYILEGDIPVSASRESVDENFVEEVIRYIRSNFAVKKRKQEIKQNQPTKSKSIKRDIHVVIYDPVEGRTRKFYSSSSLERFLQERNIRFIFISYFEKNLKYKSENADFIVVLDGNVPHNIFSKYPKLYDTLWDNSIPLSKIRPAVYNLALHDEEFFKFLYQSKFIKLDDYDTEGLYYILQLTYNTGHPYFKLILQGTKYIYELQKKVNKTDDKLHNLIEHFDKLKDSFKLHDYFKSYKSYYNIYKLPEEVVNG